jgi:translation initiation factor 1
MQTVRLRVEKRRKGKVVTVVRGLSAAGNDLPALLSRLKSQCGAGGTIQDDGLEIQGEHVERIGVLLSDLGFVVKR